MKIYIRRYVDPAPNVLSKKTASNARNHDSHQDSPGHTCKLTAITAITIFVA